jgi:hypothetical protein
MNDLNLSDSDSEAPFDTPAARKSKNTPHEEVGDTTDGAASSKPRTKESHYTTEEAREAALRKELENIRNVNRVIEGVVESLEKAKSNMDVRQAVRKRQRPQLRYFRPSPALCTMHPHFCRPGPVSSPRPSTINVSS